MFTRVLMTLNRILHCDQLVVFVQGLRPGVPAESPAMIFATPTKVVSEAGAMVEYMGANKVPDLQKIFQVIKNIDWNTRQS